MGAVVSRHESHLRVVPELGLSLSLRLRISVRGLSYAKFSEELFECLQTITKVRVFAGGVVEGLSQRQTAKIKHSYSYGDDFTFLVLSARSFERARA